MNSFELNTAIYNEVTKAAAAAFEFLRIAPGTYSAAQVVTAINKKAATWNDDAPGVCDEDGIISINIDNFACRFPLQLSFDILAKMATAYEIPTKARASFERADEQRPALLVLDVPTAAREVAKAVLKKDPERPALTFAYYDTERRALVGTNGQVLTVCAAPSAQLAPEANDRKGFLIAPALLRSARVTADTVNATDGHKVAESPALRFPNWYGVFPELRDTDALTLGKDTAAALRKAVATATKYAEAESGPNGFVKYVAIFGEAYTDRLTVRARRRNGADGWQYTDTTVQLPADLSRSFSLTVNGETFATLPAFSTLYVPTNRRPAVVTGSGVVALVFALSLPDGFTTICNTDTAPAWSRVVDPLADLLTPAEMVATTQQPEAITPEPVEVVAPEPTAATTEPTEPAAAVEPTNEPQPQPEALTEPENEPQSESAEEFGEYCPLTGEVLTPSDHLKPEELAALVAAERERIAAEATPEPQPEPMAQPEPETPSPAHLLALADFRAACKAIAKAFTAEDTHARRDAFEARRLLKSYGLTVTEYKVTTADGLTLCRFMYTYGRKSRRTLCAPLLKVAAEFTAPEDLTTTEPAPVVVATEPQLEPMAQPEPVPAELLAVLAIASELPTTTGTTEPTPEPRAEVLAPAAAVERPRIAEPENEPQSNPAQLVALIARRALYVAALLVAVLLLVLTPDRTQSTSAHSSKPQPARSYKYHMLEPDTQSAPEAITTATAPELREVVITGSRHSKRATRAPKMATATTTEPTAAADTLKADTLAAADTIEPQALETMAEPTEPEAIESTASDDAPELQSEPTEPTTEPTPAPGTAEPEPVPTTGTTATTTAPATLAPVLVAAGVPAVLIPYIIAAF